MIRRRTWALVLAGGLAVGGLAAAAVGAGVGPTAALANTGQSLSTALAANQATAGTGSTATPGTTIPGNDGAYGGAAHGRGGRFGGGFGPGGGVGGRHGGGLTVTGVSGNTITATGRRGQTITVQVSSTTAYTEAGTTASLSDVKTGSVIAVQGTEASTGTTINATAVVIVLPQVAGVVTNVSGGTLTLTSFDGTAHTVTVSGSTRYQKAGASAALSDVSSGTAIVAEGTLGSDGTLAALRVTIQVPRLGGQVTAVNGTSYTVSGRFGTSYTVAATTSTTYVNADGTTASASAVKVGSSIMAEGSLSSDGKTLTALRITVLPSGMGHGFGGHGGFGGPGGSNGFGGFDGPSGAAGTPSGATTPATTGATGTQSI